ncbi:MAG: hypothetical protein HQK84_12140, partial [Nitrospinae bacterium]|nr:hypothetical protein [Nitrospinota bacterium]
MSDEKDTAETKTEELDNVAVAEKKEASSESLPELAERTIFINRVTKVVK